MVEEDEYVAEVETRTIHTYVKGCHFGKRSLLNDELQWATIRAISNTLTCFCISFEVFKSLTQEQVKALREVKLFKLLNDQCSRRS